jgi:hypothetical protein
MTVLQKALNPEGELNLVQLCIQWSKSVSALQAAHELALGTELVPYVQHVDVNHHSLHICGGPRC